MRIRTLFAALVMVLALTACSGHHRTHTVYAGDILSISRSGAKITVVDRANSRTFNYTLRKVKRKQNGTANAKTVLRTNDFTIISAGGVWRIVMQDQPDIYIRW